MSQRDIPKQERANILGIGVSAIDMNGALDGIRRLISNGDHKYICIANVHTITESQRDERLKQINNRASIVTPDGMPLVWVSRLQGHRSVRRVYGPDLLVAACQRSLETGWSHYFYGGAPDVPELLAEQLSRRFPGLKIAGCYSPAFGQLSTEEDQTDVERINASGADILWVGLGAPKQEYWMADHLGRIEIPVMIGVGAAFDFHAGVKKQAPPWMQRSGLEWFFRLVTEPRRLWKRYLRNNPLFVWLVFLQLTGLKKYPVK